MRCGVPLVSPLPAHLVMKVGGRERPLDKGLPLKRRLGSPSRRCTRTSERTWNGGGVELGSLPVCWGRSSPCTQGVELVLLQSLFSKLRTGPGEGRTPPGQGWPPSAEPGDLGLLPPGRGLCNSGCGAAAARCWAGAALVLEVQVWEGSACDWKHKGWFAVGVCHSVPLPRLPQEAASRVEGAGFV